MTEVPREWRDVGPLRQEMTNWAERNQAPPFGPVDVLARLDVCARPDALLGLLAECRDLIAEFPPRGCGVDDLLRRVDAALTETEN